MKVRGVLRKGQVQRWLSRSDLGGGALTHHTAHLLPGSAFPLYPLLLRRRKLGNCQRPVGTPLLPEETAWQAADGWGGDTFVAWEQEGGDQARVWRTIWDSGAEAEEFERALVATVPHRYLLAQPVDPPAGLAGRWWETSSETVYISHVVSYVTFVDGPDIALLANMVETLP